MASNLQPRQDKNATPENPTLRQKGEKLINEVNTGLDKTSEAIDAGRGNLDKNQVKEIVKDRHDPSNPINHVVGQMGASAFDSIKDKWNVTKGATQQIAGNNSTVSNKGSKGKDKAMHSEINSKKSIDENDNVIIEPEDGSQNKNKKGEQ